MKTRKFFYSLLFSTLTFVSLIGTSFAGASLAANSNETVIGTRTVGSSSLNIRSKASMGKNIIGHFKKGDQINVIEKDKSGRWCRVDYKNLNNAWVYCRHLMKEISLNTRRTSLVQPSPQHGASRVPSNKSTGANMLPALTPDTNKWKQENAIKGLIFHYPPELTYQYGIDTDRGSYSYIAHLNPRYIYFKILSGTLVKCKYPDATKCNSSTNIAATPQEVYNSMVNKFAKNNRYLAGGNIKVGNIFGKEFILKKNYNNGVIIFYGKKGAYLIDNVGGDKNLFYTFLTTFKVEI